MEILKQQMPGAISAFLGGIPATSRFSMNFEGDILDIRVHYELAPTENALRKRKKKVPPSKIKRNRQRLMKFLEKPAAQPDLPLITSCERSSEGGEIPSRSPLIPPLGTCTEVGLEFDTSADTDPHSYLQASSITYKDSEHSKQGDEEKGKDEGKGQGQVDPPPLATRIWIGSPALRKCLQKYATKRKLRRWRRTKQTLKSRAIERIWKKIMAPGRIGRPPMKMNGVPLTEMTGDAPAHHGHAKTAAIAIHPSPPPAPTLEIRKTRPRLKQKASRARMHSLFVQYVYPHIRPQTKSL